MNADQEIAITRAANEIIDEVRAAATGLTGKLKEAAERVATTAQAVALAFVNGQIDAPTAEHDMRKLADATSSTLLAAGYDTKAARIELAGKALAIAFRLASALVTA